MYCFCLGYFVCLFVVVDCFCLVYVLIVLIVCCDLRCLVIVDYVGCFVFLSLGFELLACLTGVLCL